jgi:hypothetical protein
MKKLIFILLFALVSMAATSQTRGIKYYFQWLQAQDITNTRYFIWHGDTIDFNAMQITDSILISLTVDTLYIGSDTIYQGNFVLKKDSITLYVTPKQLHDSLIATVQHPRVRMGSTAATGGLSIDSTSQVMGFQSSTASRNGYLTSADWITFNNKLSLVSHTSLLTGDGTPTSYLSIDTTNWVATKYDISLGNIDSVLMASKYWVKTYVTNFKIDSITETDPVFIAWDKDYTDLINKPINDEAYPGSWNGDHTGGSSRDAIYDAFTIVYDSIAALAGGHAILTLGTPNGLWLGGIEGPQELSLDTANAATTGALSKYDWTKFNNKLTAEVDGSVTNEKIDSVRFNGTSKILTIYEAGTAYRDTITGLLATEVDGSITNEIQTLSVGGTTVPRIMLSLNGDTVRFKGLGITTLGVSGDTIKITSTEVDGSVTNEIQTLSVSGTTVPLLKLSLGGDTVRFKGIGGTALSVSGDTIKITSTSIPAVVDRSITNEKNLSALYTPSTRIFSVTDSLGTVGDTISLFNGAVPGMVNIGGGDTTKYLRQNNTWGSPSGTAYHEGQGIDINAQDTISVDINGRGTSIPLISRIDDYFIWSNGTGTKFKVGLQSLSSQPYYNAIKLQNKEVLSTTPTTSQVLTYNGTSWYPGNPSSGNWTRVASSWVGPYIYPSTSTSVPGSGEVVIIGSSLAPSQNAKLSVNYDYGSGGYAGYFTNYNVTGNGLRIDAGETNWGIPLDVRKQTGDYLFSVQGSGQLFLPKYGSATPFTGTVAKSLGVTSTGQVVEFAASGSGTVTSVGLALPSFITVTGSPVTTAGTLTGTLATQTPYYVFAANSSGVVGFNQLIDAYIPDNITVSGYLPLAGGTMTANSKIVTSASGTQSGINLPHRTQPSGLIDGDLWTTTAGLYGYIGGNVVQFGTGTGSGDMLKSTYDHLGTADMIDVDAGGTGTGSYAAGDIPYAASINPTSLYKIPIGTTGQVLTVSAGLPSWQAAAAGALPAGTGSEIQYRSSASAFGAVTGSSVSSNSITLTGTATASNFILSSDFRWKENIEPLNNLEWADKISFVSYNMKGDCTPRYGVIAQQLLTVQPDLVQEHNGYLTVNVLDMLTAKVARQDQKIKSLEERIQKLEKLINEK